ncbi:MAG: hypothetical protein IMF19_12030 [Proteobacteria bacterium]|nr:hypothetical protein [Pseudomonadota bacterium]
MKHSIRNGCTLTTINDSIGDVKYRSSSNFHNKIEEIKNGSETMLEMWWKWQSNYNVLG